MSNFVIAAGHTASGNIGCGVVANLDESVCTREISQLVGKELERKGHKVNVLIIDKSNSYNCEDCFVRAIMANELNEEEKVDLYVEIHINAGGGNGTEVLITNMVDSPIAKKYAERISESVSSSLEIRNRGVKKQSLIVLNKTSMPAILIECLFADSSDSKKYNAEVIARAISDVLDGVENKSSRWKLGWNRNEIGMWYCTDAKKGYYYTSDNGWKYIDGEWYIFDKYGYALQNTWYFYKNDGRCYYLDDECKMVHGEKDKPLQICIDGKVYLFDEDGRRVDDSKM
ncbi:N-acetylmuramoyl-L-alanine amidase [Clostridium butyricum]|uniref:N-acetylmuramoyl-L-alanine amidase n=1 Tax=Clostridium butyricum TaxID=1492 RepID=UPI00374ED3D3